MYSNDREYAKHSAVIKLDAVRTSMFNPPELDRAKRLLNEAESLIDKHGFSDLRPELQAAKTAVDNGNPIHRTQHAHLDYQETNVPGEWHIRHRYSGLILRQVVGDEEQVKLVLSLM